jgi:hypothetical protein
MKQTFFIKAASTGLQERKLKQAPPEDIGRRLLKCWQYVKRYGQTVLKPRA